MAASMVSVTAGKRVVAVMGAGPGIGRSVALRFAREGFAVALLARSVDKLATLAHDIRQLQARTHAQHDRIARSPSGAAEPLCVPTDAKDAESVKQAFATITRELGAPDVLVYNVAAFKYGGILDITPTEFDDLWKAVLPAMLERGSGTLIFSGASASLRGNAKFSGLAVGKFGLRALAQSIAREFGPQGIHAAHVIIDGMVDLEGTMKMNEGRPIESFLSSDAIAEEYWHLYTQHKTTWTHELDLRPSVERF